MGRLDDVNKNRTNYIDYNFVQVLFCFGNLCYYNFYYYLQKQQ